MTTIRLAALAVLLTAVAAQALIDEAGCKREYVTGNPNGQVYGFKACDRAMSTTGQEWCFSGTVGTNQGWVLCRGGGGVSAILCGDGIITGTEMCDPGNPPGVPEALGVCTSPGDCTAGCVCASAVDCGNHTIDVGEDCDPPGTLAPDGRVCNGQCQLPCTCQNGVQESCPTPATDEECEFQSQEGWGFAGDFDGSVGIKFGLEAVDLKFASTEAFTVMCDVCIDTLPGSTDMVLFNGGSSAIAEQEGWQLSFTNLGELKFTLVSSTPTLNGGGSAQGTLQAGKCYRLAATRDTGTTCLGYVYEYGSGATTMEEVFTGTDSTCTSGQVDGADRNFTIGANDATPPSFTLQSRVDNCVVWRALKSQAQLDAMLEAEPDCAGANVEFCYRFEDGAGLTAVDESSTPIGNGTVTGTTANYNWITSPLGGGAETQIGDCSWSTEECDRTTCTCKTSTAGASCGSPYVIEAGEACDTDSPTAGTTGSCGSCPNQSITNCCTSCACTVTGETPPARSIHTTFSWGCTQECPPAKGTCTSGLPAGGGRECCDAFGTGTCSQSNFVTHKVDRVLNFALANANPVLAAPSCDLLNVAGKINGQSVETYHNFTRTDHRPQTYRGDGALRDKFTRGFMACSGDWSYECSTTAQCATINANWTCQSIPADLSVFLVRNTDGKYVADNATWCGGIATDGSFSDCQGSGIAVMFDVGNQHFQDVWVAHVLALKRNKVCTLCSSDGEASPTGPFLTNGQCVTACGTGSVAIPSCVSRVFYDNVIDPETAGTYLGFMSGSKGSTNVVRDPAPGRCTTDSPPVCHDGDVVYDRAEYARDVGEALKAIQARLSAVGMHGTINATGSLQTFVSNSAWRNVFVKYAAADTIPRVELEFSCPFGLWNDPRAHLETETNLPSIETCLDVGRWMTGKCTGAYCASPNTRIVVEEGGPAARSARHREANMATSLLMRGLTSDTRGRYSTAANINGSYWFGDMPDLGGGGIAAVQDWYTSTTVGVNLLGEPVGEWFCAVGCASSCADSGNLTLTGNPNCGVYVREYVNGAVFFNAKATGTRCPDTTLSAASDPGCSGGVCTLDTNGCTGTTYTSVDLDIDNKLTSASLCILAGDGQRIAATSTDTLTIEPLGAAIVYDGACP